MSARWFAFICGALAALSLCAQETYPVGTIYFRAADSSLPPAVGAPFCGERRNVRVTKQPDGTQKTEEYAPVRLCRDSAGRTRYESPVYLKPNGPQVGPLLIQIRDPVAGAKYVVYAVNKIVYHQQLKFVRTVHPPSRMPLAAESDLLATGVDLGTQMMEGVLVEGRRYTLAPGSSGNDTAITRTSESWWSPELAEFVMEKTGDAVNGELVHRLIDITREEPDPSLFRPPADYAGVVLGSSVGR